MFYAKLASDGTLERYPYTLTDLRRDNPNTSFSAVIDDSTARSLGAVPVKPSPQPVDDYTVNLERTAVLIEAEWEEQWLETPATPDQIADRTKAKAAEVRADRTERLAACDWTQLPDSPANHEAWATYRQELRDVTDQAGFPWDVVWPETP